MEKVKVAIQGIAGSFHELAAQEYFGPNIETLECDSFKVLCNELDAGSVDYAVMAIENSIAGSLLPNYQLLKEFHFKILGEQYLHIQMSLMAANGVKLEDVRKIYSHPIAIRQCAEFLNSLTDVEITQAQDTAGSAKLIRDNNYSDRAAIAGTQAAELYGLNVIEKGIETNKHNYTRFLILGRTGIIDPKNNKASVSFELVHKSGALAEVLNILTDYSINLTKIQSTPIVGKPYEYNFHVDFEWTDYQKYEDALHAILKCVSSLSLFGEYEKGSFARLGDGASDKIIQA